MKNSRAYLSGRAIVLRLENYKKEKQRLQNKVQQSEIQ